MLFYGIILLAIGLLTLYSGNKRLSQAARSDDAQEKEALYKLGSRQVKWGRIITTISAIFVVIALAVLGWVFFIVATSD